MWLFNLKKHVWYFLNDHFLDDARVYNNVNDLLIAVGFPRGSVVRVFLISHGLFFLYSRLALSPPPEATPVLQGELATHVAPRTPVLPRARSQRAEEPAEPSDDDDSDMPGLELEEVPCQTPLYGSPLRDVALRNAVLEALVAQHRAERIQHRDERDQHMALRQDVAALHEQHATDIAALHAVLTDVNARNATDNRQILRMLFITFFFFAVIMCTVMKLSKPEFVRSHYTNGHA
jgi:hypothetical protein